MKTKRPKLQQSAQFMGRLSVLLKEGYTFEESIRILSPYHATSKEQFDEIISQAFLTGQTPAEIFSAIGIKKRFLFAISIAQSTGDLADTLQKISNNMQFYEQSRERLKRLLYYPIFLFLFISGLFLAYRQLFLPRMQSMIQTRSQIHDVKSLKLSQFFLNIPDYFMYCFILLMGATIAFGYWISRKDVRRQLTILTRIPFLHMYVKQRITEQLARELGNLLVHGFSLQEALSILQQQLHHRYISLISSDLLLQVKNGEMLSKAVMHNDYLLNRFEQFIVHGEHSGTLGRELVIFADLLEEKTQTILNTTLKVIQPTLLMLIAICVLAAYLSILLPIYNMLEFV